MIREFAEGFWAQRARDTEGSIRWTDDRMLSHDHALLDQVLPDGGELLDLGCGTGDLFSPFLPRLSHVTAVDMIPEFVARLPQDEKVEGVVSDLTSYAPDRSHDFGLLFGVVTHLSPEDELAVYQLLRRAVRPTGAVLVKNQCSTGEEMLVDRWSEAFGQRYVGRYPAVSGQRELLGTVFDRVEVLRYPADLNPWPDTAHVAFLCS